MSTINGIITITLFIGIIFIIIYFTKKSSSGQKEVIYKYVPRTLEEEENEPVYVSEIFNAMFSQPSTWINSIENDKKRQTGQYNAYFISQS